ncbi:uncharacterized protein LOC109839159 [Asparagus officinalis]|uniref:uncharacterized protein LOC109839159 n=1 Tax=Asparagus officinalis TaxID=4686 RepID=UPI00098E3AA0|nr:uncharacterized protein LOC109839159 [Asparagus officinalis]
MTKKFDYEFVKNEPKRIRVICRYKETYGCPWMLFASPVKNKKGIEIKRFIAAQLRPVLKVRPEIHPKDVQKEFLTRYGLRLEYSKIWWGKERAQEAMYGFSYESYDQLRWYEQKVKETNPGSYICIDQNEGKFRRLFICYAACIISFLNGCRPLLFLDETFLKDRYKGTFRSAIAYDGDQGIFPLASKLKALGMKSKDTKVLGNLLQSACYKYTIAEWNDYMKDIYEMSPAAYKIAINYSPEHWANAFFPGIRLTIADIC